MTNSVNPICEGKRCPIKDTCLRFTSPTSDHRTRQEYLSPPYKDGECTEHIKIPKSEQSLN
jgi:hypothetical protein